MRCVECSHFSTPYHQRKRERQWALAVDGTDGLLEKGGENPLQIAGWGEHGNVALVLCSQLCKWAFPYNTVHTHPVSISVNIGRRLGGG